MIESVVVAPGADAAAQKIRRAAVALASTSWAAAVTKLGKKTPGLAEAIPIVQAAWASAEQELDTVSLSLEDALLAQITDDDLRGKVYDAILAMYAVPRSLSVRFGVLGAARACRRNCDAECEDYVKATAAIDGPVAKADPTSLQLVERCILGLVESDVRDRIRSVMAELVFDARERESAPSTSAEPAAAFKAPAAAAMPPISVTLPLVVRWLHEAEGTKPSDSMEAIGDILQWCAALARLPPPFPAALQVLRAWGRARVRRVGDLPCIARRGGTGLSSCFRVISCRRGRHEEY